jgi:predicted ferric reductase
MRCWIGRPSELTIKASGGPHTRAPRPAPNGVPAKLAGPFGALDYRPGGHDRIWIAGRIGVAPFLSWIRSIDGQFDRTNGFCYSVARAPSRATPDEIRAVTNRHRSLLLHLVCARTDGQLTPPG